MENKKTVKVLVILLIVAVIIIGVMAFFIYKLGTEKAEEKEKVANSNNQVTSLENTVEDLQGKLDTIANIINSNNTTSNNTKSSDNIDEEKVTEKQVLDAYGYKVILYSNNEVKLFFEGEDAQTVFGIENSDASNKSSRVTGLSGKVKKMHQANNGTSVDPITFFIMEDGSVSYLMPVKQIVDNNNIIPSSFKISGTIENIENVVDMKNSKADVVIAITKDGKEIKCWNEWMENME